MYHIACIECVVSDYWPGHDHKLNVLVLNKTVIILLSWATKLSSSQYYHDYMNEHKPQSQFDSSSIMLI